MPKKTFRESFSEARKNKKKTFMWEGKSYSTGTAEEKAKGLTSEKLSDKSNEAYEKGKSSPSKSNQEISKSYTNEKQYRLGDKVTAKGLNPDKYSDRMKSNITGGAHAKKRPRRLRKINN